MVQRIGAGMPQSFRLSQGVRADRVPTMGRLVEIMFSPTTRGRIGRRAPRLFGVVWLVNVAVLRADGDAVSGLGMARGDIRPLRRRFRPAPPLGPLLTAPPCLGGALFALLGVLDMLGAPSGAGRVGRSFTDATDATCTGGNPRRDAPTGGQTGDGVGHARTGSAGRIVLPPVHISHRLNPLVGVLHHVDHAGGQRAGVVHSLTGVAHVPGICRVKRARELDHATHGFTRSGEQPADGPPVFLHGVAKIRGELTKPARFVRRVRRGVLDGPCRVLARLLHRFASTVELVLSLRTLLSRGIGERARRRSRCRTTRVGRIDVRVVFTDRGLVRLAGLLAALLSLRELLASLRRLTLGLRQHVGVTVHSSAGTRKRIGGPTPPRRGRLQVATKPVSGLPMPVASVDTGEPGRRLIRRSPEPGQVRGEFG